MEELCVPKSERFASVRTAEDFHTIHRIIVVFIVDNCALFNRDFLSSIAYIDHAKQVIRDIKILDGRKGALVRLATFSCQRQYVHAIPENIINCIEQQFVLQYA